MGEPLHLKNKFGSGYSVKINFDLEKEKEACDFLLGSVPSATLMESFPGNRTYQVATKDFKMSKLLKALTSKEGKEVIKDWGVSQTR